jgi:hypothetical protein
VKQKHVCRGHTRRLLALALVLTSGFAVGRAHGFEGNIQESLTGRSFADPPVSVRVAPELLIAPKLQRIPLEAYGFSAAVGPRFEGRGFYFIPALAVDLLWGKRKTVSGSGRRC